MPTETAVPVSEMPWSVNEAMEFATIVELRQQAKVAEDNAKRLREDYDRRIEAMLLMVSDVPNRIAVGDYTVQRVTSTSASRLEPRKLLELGVSAGIVQQATVPGKSYSYVMVTGGAK